MTEAVLLLLALLAFANGANDNGKGVATLVGYGAAKPRPALLWAAATTAMGAAFSFWFAAGLLRRFSAGLFDGAAPLDAPFFLAVLAGAFGWVMLAAVTGLPVSTTHAIAGALAGAGLAAFGPEQLRWDLLATRFALPLAVSPALSLALVYLLSGPIARAVDRFAGRCACVTGELPARPAGAGLAAAAVAEPRLAVVAGEEAACEARGSLVAIRGSAAAAALHWTTAGLVGFARGWNDAPKIAALGLVALPGAGALAFALVAAAMAAGGLLAAGRVLRTLAHRVTEMPLPEALSASAVTAALVSLASWNGLPVSTTHVSTGAIIGAGVSRDPRAVRWGTVSGILLSWLVTLPVAGLLAAAARLLVGQIG